MTVAELENVGVLYFRFPDVEGVNALASERGYKNRDEIIVSPEKMGAIYETKVRQFFDEHLHEDEEIRYIRDGAGYFDVRNEGDEWIRIKLVKDDLIILPAGIYHRFTTDDTNVCLSLFPFRWNWHQIFGDGGLTYHLLCKSISRLCVCSRKSPSGRL